MGEAKNIYFTCLKSLLLTASKIMSLKLYSDVMSQPCRALYLFFRNAGIPYEDVPIALRNKQHLTQEFKAINPFQKVPTLVDETAANGPLVIKESCVAAKYAASKYLSPSSHWWPMEDERKSLLIDEYLHWQHLNLRIFGSLIFIHTVLQPARTNKPPNVKEAHINYLRLGEVVDVFEQHYLDKGTFITGDKISVADLFAVCELMQPWSAGFEVSTTRPRVAEWMQEVIAATQPHFDQAHLYNKKVRDTIGVGIQEAYGAYLEEMQQKKAAGGQ